LHIAAHFPHFVLFSGWRVNALKKDVAFDPLIKLQDTAPGRCLAATAFSYQSQSFPFLDVERHAVHGFDIGDSFLETPAVTGKYMYRFSTS